MQCLVAKSSKVGKTFKKGNKTKILALTTNPKYHKDIVQQIAMMEHEPSGFFVEVLMHIIKVGPLSEALITDMNQVFSGRWVNEDKAPLYHVLLNESGVLLAEFGGAKACYLAIQLANMVGRKVFPIETREKLTHAVLEDVPKSEEDRWISRIVQSYFLID